MSSDKINTILLSVTGFLLASTVSLVGWIAVKVWDMNPTVIETARRVDRIVEVLPDVRTRLAMEDLERRFGVALLTTEPTESPSGQWHAAVHYMDFANGRQKVFITQLKGPDDQLTALTVAGLATRTAREKLSFQDFLTASADVKRPVSVPKFVDNSASFVILRSRVDYEERLTQILGAPVRQIELEKGQVKWEELIKQLNAQEASLRPN